MSYTDDIIDADSESNKGQKNREVSAPGKLVLAGEYAVLEGSAAWVTAVDRRAVVHFDLKVHRPAADASLRVSSHSCVEQCLSDDVDGGYFDLLRKVVAVVEQDREASFSGLVHVDTSAMEVGDKLGIGSSAAVAVAFTYALLSVANGCDDGTEGDFAPSREDVHTLAHRAHLAFSEGRGSGVDVAAAVYGGSISFQRVPNAELPVVEPAPLDAKGLEVLIVYSGHSQSTRSFVAKVQHLKDPSEGQPALFQEIMIRLASAATRAMASTTTGELLPSMNAAYEAMIALGEASGADIVSAPHRQIAALAAYFSGVAKPSGAGGGDVALAFFRSKKDAQAAREAFAAQGFSVVSMQLGAPGVG
ncbi:MAG: hypothetical protein GY822_24825 [Deltaproteobacteria bacterium]|nr:hypothetical protein [Deltaproteobacteria bacterium]